MIELTPQLAARLAEKKRQWADDKGKGLPPPEVLACRVCKKPSEWATRTCENRIPPRGMVPLPLASKPMLVNVSRRFTSPIRAGAHEACLGGLGFKVHETVLWAEKVLA